jgi:DNA-binding NtrC family response regulator
MTDVHPVLVSWIALNNDPFEREGDGYRIVNGQSVPGPTLTVLFDKDSSLAGQIQDVVLLHRQTDGLENERERRAVQETTKAIRELGRDIRVHLEPWHGDDPTDHRSIFDFLREKIPAVRRRFAGRELIIHVSPGTPAMHTLWVLMAETGLITQPFRLVQSLRRKERHGGPALQPVNLGIETFYKIYKASRPAHITSDQQVIAWDPAKFRTAGMKALFKEARWFAHLNVPVLILGERGTGKTTLANWIRLHSPYRREEMDPHWPAVACGQYTPDTMRAELFGYRKGAFTGAINDKEGLLSTADGDTLFLDEVGDVSRDLQRLLIKVLEEKQYFPLGDQKPHRSDFRLLAATNLQPGELRRRLDPDFLDRIGLLSLRIPPLREIPEEISWLWEETYERAAVRAGVSGSRAQLGADHHRRVVSALKSHLLPGNLRDLFRVAYRILGARCDMHEPLSAEKAVEYGLHALASHAIADDSSLSRAVARAFADSSPLDGLLDASKRIPTKLMEKELKAFLAQEIRRLSRQRGVPVGQLCDVTDRALRMWAGETNKKIISAERNNYSENRED